MPLPESADPKQRFRDTLTALLAVKKSDLQKIETALEAVRKAKERRKNRSIDK
jgi:hypothetical protein